MIGPLAQTWMDYPAWHLTRPRSAGSGADGPGALAQVGALLRRRRELCGLEKLRASFLRSPQPFEQVGPNRVNPVPEHIGVSSCEFGQAHLGSVDHAQCDDAACHA